MAGRSKEDFLAFLDFLGDKGLVPGPTAASRKATARQVSAAMSDSESQDVTSIDLEALMRRFHNLNPSKYSPGSLQTYESRMRASLHDFAAYLVDPLSFKPTSSGRARNRSSDGKARQESGHRTAAVSHPRDGRTAEPVHHASAVHVLPIAIRSDLTVQVANLPFDLSRAEAQRIANIVLAHAMVDEIR